VNASVSSRAPLHGIRVVELANYVSAPFATMMLADLGADVVKVENVKGDPMRKVGRSSYPVSPMYVSSNHNKRSITLDLKDPEGVRVARELLVDADVMVSNWRPSVADRLGLGDDVLAELNPRLIRVWVSGFGATGPLADAPTYDSIIQAHYGSVTDPSGNTPPNIASTYIVDKTVAVMACQAALAALLGRERGGGGTRVDLSLLDADAYVNFLDTMANRTFLEGSPEEPTNTHSAATRALRTADGWMIVVPVSGQQVRGAFDAIGAPEQADELLKIRDAAEMTVRMLDALEERTRTRPTAEWAKIFADHDVPAAPCLTIDQHLDDAQVRHNATYGVAEWDGLGPVRFARYPARFGNWPLEAQDDPTAAPTPGEHTDEILEELRARSE
jgi:crotonobetainyl-CoA:carnitine CoA-transferase CaiB-like acyl-CoA transferase